MYQPPAMQQHQMAQPSMYSSSTPQPQQNMYQPPATPSYQQPQPRPQQNMYQPPFQQQQQQQQQQQRGNGMTGDRYTVDTTRCNLIPLSGVHPYLDKNWYIRVCSE